MDSIVFRRRITIAEEKVWHRPICRDDICSEKCYHEYKKNQGDWDSRQTVETAITVLQAVTSSDFKADEVEIGYCNVENPRFRKLTE